VAPATRLCLATIQNAPGVVLSFIKTKRRRVFDAGGPFLGRQHFAWRSLDRYERPKRAGELDCKDPGVNLSPILTANASSSELEIVRPRRYSGDAVPRVAATR